MESTTENDRPTTPPDIRDAADKVSFHLLPDKSKEVYESAYKAYTDWRTSKGANSSSESVLLAYFDQMSQQYKPTTIWSLYSKLKSTINIREKVDISSYKTLSAFLKKQSRGFRSKKSSVFTSEEVQSFLTRAPDDKYLATKIVLIFGIFGALRTDELTNIQVRDMKKQGNLLQVQVPKTKTMLPRSFIIPEDCVEYVTRYQSLRPENVPSGRFFINYQNGKCTAQVIGKNKFAGMPKEIAEFLDLPDAASYTGHTFRRTSATMLVDNGANMETLKRHGGWKSSTVAEGYIAESLGNKKNIGDMIMSSLNLPSTATSADNRSVKISSPKRPKMDDSINAVPSTAKVHCGPEQKVFTFENCTNVTINYTGNPGNPL
ncbi:uncharacterized protein LOC125502027 [Athalia rosae]|uniref:uncharacterized protein LOC125500931 n=1 Tax=Athalia rosae TaxID=37344 RepID=UPI000626204A|nr:uncharacterized protein LOC125500931 [Athalia rosae]XP_048513867.1 uncharacterized protein LOC125501640 [Athalia rosae]XP_048515466.1 uncharacterized protein LOC125502027 [Athalia rosae]